MGFLSSLVEWSLNHRAIVLGATILFAIAGIDSALKMKIDAVPDITTIQVQVITAAPALSAIEIEQYVTFAVERSITGTPHLEEVRSISRYGLSVVTAVFKDGTDIHLARQLIGEKLRDASSAIPARYGRPDMGPISTGLGEIFQFTLRSKNHSMRDLTSYLNWNINPRLKSVPGIVEVNTFGGEVKQYQVILNSNRMQALGITGTDVFDSIQKNNAAAGGGYIEKGNEHFVIGTEGMISSIDDMKNIIVGSAGKGNPVKLSSIAEIRIGGRLRRGASTMDGNGEVTGAITMMLMNENSLTASENVKKAIAEISKTLPDGMRIESFYDRSEVVKKTIRTVFINLLEGAILVIVVLLLMLGNIRAGIVISLTIPLAMFFAIMIMRIRDAPANLMSMGAIDFGLIIDGAVIVVENAARRISKTNNFYALSDTEKLNVIRDSTIEVRKATIFGEIIIAIVYVPILTLSGIEGKMFIPMALTVLYALGGAFILTLTVIPVLASMILNYDSNHSEETVLFRKIKNFYIPILDQMLSVKKKVIWFSFAGFLFSCILFSVMGGEFIPDLDEGSLLVEVTRLPSASLSESIATETRLEKNLLKKFPEITHVVSRTGSPEIATDPMGIDRTDSYLILSPKEEWRYSREDLIEKISQMIETTIPEIAFSISQPIQMRTNELIAGIRSDVGIKIYGEDLLLLKKTGEEIAKVLRKINGLHDFRIEQLQGLHYIRVRPKRESIARYGTDINEINQAIEMISVGSIPGNVYEGNKRFEIAIKTDLIADNALSSISRIPIRTKISGLVPLGDLAEISVENGPVQISHENASRRMLVEFNVRGRDMLGAVKEAEAEINRNVKLPDGYRIEFGGEYKSYTSARNRLLVVVPLTIVVILFFLWIAFGKIAPAILILLNVPFAFIGGILLLFLRNIPFSISAGVGFVALFGVAVLNGIVLLSFAGNPEENESSPQNSIREAAILRLRPVLTTAIVAITGFIPMSISTSVGAEVQRPLATVVIGGIISSTILTLIVLPAVYSAYYNFMKTRMNKHA